MCPPTLSYPYPMAGGVDALHPFCLDGGEALRAPLRSHRCLPTLRHLHREVTIGGLYARLALPTAVQARSLDSARCRASVFCFYSVHLFRSIRQARFVKCYGRNDEAARGCPIFLIRRAQRPRRGTTSLLCGARRLAGGHPLLDDVLDSRMP